MSALTAADLRNLIEARLQPDFETTDAGYDLTGQIADLVMERGGVRYEITIRRLES